MWVKNQHLYSLSPSQSLIGGFCSQIAKLTNLGELVLWNVGPSQNLLPIHTLTNLKLLYLEQLDEFNERWSRLHFIHPDSAEHLNSSISVSVCGALRIMHIPAIQQWLPNTLVALILWLGIAHLVIMSTTLRKNSYLLFEYESWNLNRLALNLVWSLSDGMSVMTWHLGFHLVTFPWFKFAGLHAPTTSAGESGISCRKWPGKWPQLRDVKEASLSRICQDWRQLLQSAVLVGSIEYRACLEF